MIMRVHALMCAFGSVLLPEHVCMLMYIFMCANFCIF